MLKKFLKKIKPNNQNSKQEINIELLDELNFFQIPHVYHLLNSWNENTQLYTIDRICNCSGFDDFSKILKLDNQFRSRTSMTWMTDWKNKKINEYIPNCLNNDQKKKLIGITTFHPSGFFREKAINYITQNPDPFYIPYLIIRINDWVDVIRDKSLSTLLKLLQASNAEELLFNLRSFKHIKYYSRYDYHELLDEINDLISEKVTDSDYEKALKNGDEKTRFSIISELIKKRKITEIFAKNYLLKETVPRIRFQIFHYYTKNKWIFGFSETNNLLQRENNGNNKIILLGCLIDMNSEESKNILIKCLSDNKKRVRNFSRNLLIQKYKIDSREIYLNNLKNKINEKYSIIGLSELQNQKDIEIIKEYIHDNSKYLRFALIGLKNLEYDAKFNDFEKFLLKNDFSISRNAYNLLKNKITENDCLKIDQRINKANPEFVLMNLMNLLLNTNKWDQVYYAIKYMNHNHEIIRNQCQWAIRNWNQNFNKSYIKCSLQQKKRLANIVDARTDLLGEKEAAKILFSLNN